MTLYGGMREDGAGRGMANSGSFERMFELQKMKKADLDGSAFSRWWRSLCFGQRGCRRAQLLGEHFVGVGEELFFRDLACVYFG